MVDPRLSRFELAPNQCSMIYFLDHVLLRWPGEPPRHLPCLIFFAGSYRFNKHDWTHPGGNYNSEMQQTPFSILRFPLICRWRFSSPPDSYHGHPGQGFTTQISSNRVGTPPEPLIHDKHLRPQDFNLHAYRNQVGRASEPLLQKAESQQENLDLVRLRTVDFIFHVFLKSSWNPSGTTDPRQTPQNPRFHLARLVGITLETFLNHCSKNDQKCPTCSTDGYTSILAHNIHVIHQLHPLLSWISWGATSKRMLKLHPAKKLKSWWPAQTFDINLMFFLVLDPFKWVKHLASKNDFIFFFLRASFKSTGENKIEHKKCSRFTFLWLVAAIFSQKNAFHYF